jgi:hypothetical protein
MRHSEKRIKSPPRSISFPFTKSSALRDIGTTKAASGPLDQLPMRINGRLVTSKRDERLNLASPSGVPFAIFGPLVLQFIDPVVDNL